MCKATQLNVQLMSSYITKLELLHGPVQCFLHISFAENNELQKNKTPRHLQLKQESSGNTLKVLSK
jgi:hypothetical protein